MGDRVALERLWGGSVRSCLDSGRLDFYGRIKGDVGRYFGNVTPDRLPTSEWVYQAIADELGGLLVADDKLEEVIEGLNAWFGSYRRRLAGFFAAGFGWPEFPLLVHLEADTPEEIFCICDQYGVAPKWCDIDLLYRGGARSQASLVFYPGDYHVVLVPMACSLYRQLPLDLMRDRSIPIKSLQ